MEVNQIPILQDYDNKLGEAENIFISQTDELSNALAKNICDAIREEVYVLKGVNIPVNDPRLSKKVTDELWQLIDGYASTIQANKINQGRQLSEVFQGMPVDKLDSIKYDFIDVEKEVENVKRKIIDRIITYFNFENQKNSMYWEKSRKVEEIVKKEVTLDKIKKFAQNTESLYIEIMEQIKAQRERFINEFTASEPNIIEEPQNRIVK
jgi:hypothetical protein